MVYNVDEPNETVFNAKGKIMGTKQQNTPELSKQHEIARNAAARITADYRQRQFSQLPVPSEYMPKILFSIDGQSTNYMDITVDELVAIQAILTKRVYEFNELPEDIQQEIIQKFADINVDFEWWGNIYEDAKNVLLKIAGFGLTPDRLCTGDFIEYAEECAKKIIVEHGETCETWGTATNYLVERMSMTTQYSIDAEIGIIDRGYEQVFDRNCDELDKEFLRSILEDYSIMLQKQYKYLTGEESIIETIKANEYKFTEDGEIA